MINLLPPQEKEQLMFDQKKRLVTILAIIAGVALVCLVFALVWTKFAILKASVAHKTAAQTYQKTAQQPEYVALRQAIANANTVLLKANTFYKKQTRLSDALEIISYVQKPAGIHVTHIDVQQDASSSALQVRMEGISDTREDLLAFKKVLEEQKKMSNLFFPPSSWTKPKNIVFNITFTVP